MGNSYSDLHLYFHTKKTEKYKGTGYTVTVKQENYTGCSDFVVFTHAITFDPPNKGTNYNVLLYDGTDQKSEGTRVFGYYYPRNDSEIIKEVSTYYSVLLPNTPLVVSFGCCGNFYNCYLSSLKNAGWDRSYNITKYSFSNHLTKEDLFKRFNELSRKRTIQFTIGNTVSKISSYRQEILDKTKYRYIFIPKGDESILGSDYLFAIDFINNVPELIDKIDSEKPRYCKVGILDRLCKGSANKECKSKLKEYYDMSSTSKLTHNNRIDPYYLSSVNKHFYDGIMVYLSTDDKLYPKTLCEEAKYNTGTALLLEFVDIHNSKIQIRRKDKNGYLWSEEKVEYTNDTTLIAQLSKFDKEVKEKECVTVILDNKKNYLGARVNSDGSKQVCKKYTHEFTSAHNPVFLFARTVIAIPDLKESSFKSKHVEVYYLNAGGKDDTQPFLIVFFTNGVEAQNNKKAYHFKDTYDFKDWVEFNKGKSDGLEKKVEKIEQYCACLSNIITVRWYAHQILIGEEPPPPKPEKKTTPTRPPEVRPADDPEPLPVWLIVGCVAAGVVLIVTSVVVYGIYWYNTTIKLLT